MGLQNLQDVLNQTKQEERKTIQQVSETYSEEYLRQLEKLLGQTAFEIVPDFTIDDDNREILLNLFYYFLGIEGKYDLRKGLWIMGPNGTGKTKLLNIFSAFNQRRYKGFKVYECMTISNEYAANGDLDKYTFSKGNKYGSQKPVDMGFDELGRETIPANHFGQKLNVMQYILHIRYSLWQSEGIKTYITTNLTAEDAGELYNGLSDKFITDRCREMFNVVSLTGKSRRK